MEKSSFEEQIHSRLRELTDELRRIRRELTDEIKHRPPHTPARTEAVISKPVGGEPRPRPKSSSGMPGRRR